MADEIHCRIRKGGKRVYAVWSTIVDAYISDMNLSEEEVKEFVKQKAIQYAIDDHEYRWEDRIARANAKGTSSRIEEPGDLMTRWRKERKH